jgi:cellulose synthase/poly-beta-1,6-N-acetylglucosamine synthase-like glycosyltransferase
MQVLLIQSYDFDSAQKQNPVIARNMEYSHCQERSNLISTPYFLFLHSLFYTLFSIFFSLYSLFYALFSILFSLYSFLYALFSILYTLCSILYILFPQIPTSMKNNDPPCNGTCEICDCLKSPPTLNPKPTIHNS